MCRSGQSPGQQVDVEPIVNILVFFFLTAGRTGSVAIPVPRDTRPPSGCACWNGCSRFPCENITMPLAWGELQYARQDYITYPGCWYPYLSWWTCWVFIRLYAPVQPRPGLISLTASLPSLSNNCFHRCRHLQSLGGMIHPQRTGESDPHFIHIDLKLVNGANGGQKPRVSLLVGMGMRQPPVGFPRTKSCMERLWLGTVVHDIFPSKNCSRIFTCFSTITR